MFDRLDSACLRLVYSRSYYIAFCNLNCLHIIKKKRRRVDSLSFHKAVEALDGKQQRALTDDNPRRVLSASGLSAHGACLGRCVSRTLETA